MEQGPDMMYNHPSGIPYKKLLSDGEKRERQTQQRIRELEISLAGLPNEFSRGQAFNEWAIKTALDFDEDQVGAMAGSMYTEMRDVDILLSEMIRVGLIEQISPEKYRKIKN
mgnify:CR=1 FL=1